jgi:BirA family transcriptional regulator, biotin operon repressor / biotin---[acetyl-CoA-carboxylase] ligase
MNGDRIAAELVALGTRYGTPLTVAAITGSTNDDARAAARAGAPHGAAFLADAQSDGRGRREHRWHSPPGENIYLSLLLLPQAHVPGVSALTLAVGVAVAEVVDAHLAAPRARIKWPNDVYVDDAKLAGVLVEATVQGSAPPVVVVGVGLNVLAERFPDGFASPPTSLARAGGVGLDRDRIAAELIASIGARYDAFAASGLPAVLAELRARDWLAGKRVAIDAGEGTAGGIDDEGRLVMICGESRRLVGSGEVALVIRQHGDVARGPG